MSSKSSLSTPLPRYQKLSRCRGDEGGDVEPFEAVVDAGDGALAARRPDPPQDRLQRDTVLVGGEDLDHRAGMALRFFGDGFGEVLWDGPPLPAGIGQDAGADLSERSEP